MLLVLEVIDREAEELCDDEEFFLGLKGGKAACLYTFFPLMCLPPCLVLSLL